MSIEYRTGGALPREQVLDLYRAVNWSSAKKPDALMAALQNAHCVISAWQGDELIGLGNAISDGHLVVYYPHLVVRPEFQGEAVGRAIAQRLAERYAGFHQQCLLADGAAVGFYEKMGYQRAGSTVPMWIYDGSDHG